ncbi:hypothetical protein [Haloterrigena salinisoli]|uniref:hypothetical protein n=1 Tax=Haloterrigena salinisoli TaxID=3132747 RepID=UPI0030CD6475
MAVVEIPDDDPIAVESHAGLSRSAGVVLEHVDSDVNAGDLEVGLFTDGRRFVR